MNQEDLVFGRLKPEEIIDFDNAKGVSSEERNSIYEFAVTACSGVTGAEDIDGSVYRNVGTCEIYLVVEYDGDEKIIT